jgi:DNA-binding PadR family transcriptional regulator
MLQHHDHDRRPARGQLTTTLTGRQGGGRTRPFKQEELRLVLLQLMAERPRCRAELIEAIEDRLGRASAPNLGAIDPTLAMLEDLGHAGVTARDDGDRFYAVTAKGTVLLDGNRATVDGVFRRMRAVRNTVVAPQLLRPLESLREALRARLQRSDFTLDAMRDMEAAIEAASIAVARA